MKISPRSSVTLCFAAYGAMVGAQVGAIPVLKLQSGVDAFNFGILASLGAAANILGQAFGGRVNRRFDHRSVLLFILPVAFAGFIFSLTAHSIAAFGLSFMIFNLGIGTLDLFMNAEGSMVEHESVKPIFASFHAAVLFAMSLTGLAGGFISVNYGPLWASLLGVPVVAVAIYAVYAAIPSRPIKKFEDAARASDLPRKALMLIGIILGLSVSSELTCVQWAGQLLSARQPALAEYSGLGLTFYGLCNGTVRMIGDRLRHRFSDIQLVSASFVIAACGLSMLALGLSFEYSVIALAISGFGLALIYPCMFSIAAGLAPKQRAAALGLVSAVSGPPRILLPIVLGSLASSFGLDTIYTAAAAACCIAMGFVYWASLEIARTRKEELVPAV